MNTIAVDKKMECGRTLHIHYNHVDYIRVKVGKSGECCDLAWYVVSECADKIKREELIGILSNITCEVGLPRCKSCYDFVARLITPPKEEKK